MPDYNKYLMTHGESWILYIVEQIERVDGIVVDGVVSLEDRWNAVSNMGADQSAALAA
ncbi:MAG: hypothetical protein KGI37_04835 [Alphaproteobacteria bacterium]|nr:hypothetical protein [Alphaproteobacteria bacterium]